VFLDAHSIVSPNWLSPLIASLEKTPDSLVYPVIDVVDGPISLGKMIQSDEAVGAFDWSLRFRWEFVDRKDRLPLVSDRDSQENEVVKKSIKI
jgi:hypothetical protein